MDTIDMFLAYIQDERRCSPHTAVAYKIDLQQYVSFLFSRDLTVENASHKDIRSWIVRLMSENNTTRTINRKLSTLKKFYKFLLRTKRRPDNPMEKVMSPKQSKRLTEFVSEEDMGNLFDSLEFTDDFEGVRDRTILELFYATGIRLSELVQLKREDLDFSRHTIKVMGKRKKERIIPIAPPMAAQLQNYLFFLEKKFGNIDYNQNIFVTNSGKPVYPQLIYKMVRKYLDAVTTIDKRSPHVLRHTFATHLLDNGAELLAIKELLGHTSLAATQIYAGTSIEKIKKTYNQAHPRA